MEYGYILKIYDKDLYSEKCLEKGKSMLSEEKQISDILSKLNREGGYTVHDTFMLCPSIQKLVEMKETVGRPEDIEDVRKLRLIPGKLEKKDYE